MGAEAPHTVAFSVRGPIARADLAGLTDRVCALLREAAGGVALCDVSAVQPDAVTVDALARLQLGARRTGCCVRLCNASPALLELVEFMGLSDVLCDDEITGLSPSQVRPTKEAELARMLSGTAVRARRLVRANGVGLCVETLGDDTSPTILLVAGAACSMDWWDEAFCERLAAGPRHVARYDLRDTGQSVSYPAGAPTYTGADLVADAIGLLDALGVARAHVVGMSMGGGIAQRVARDHAERVATLTLMSTSSGAAGLPPMSDELASFFSNPPPTPDWSDPDAVVEYMVEGERPYAGSLEFDEARVRELAARTVARTIDVEASLTNHSLLESGEPARRPLSDIRAPTLVIHGTEDPLFPIAHGEALAAAIPGARLLALEGVGHQLPPRQLWDRVVPAILEHTAED